MKTLTYVLIGVSVGVVAAESRSYRSASARRKRAAPPGAPSASSERRTKCPKGRAQDVRAFAEGTWMYRQRTRPAFTVLEGRMPGGRRCSGALLFGYSSLGQARESDPLAGMRVERAGRAPRRSAEKQTSQTPSPPPYIPVLNSPVCTSMCSRSQARGSAARNPCSPP